MKSPVRSLHGDKQGAGDRGEASPGGEGQRVRQEHVPQPSDLVRHAFHLSANRALSRGVAWFYI